MIRGTTGDGFERLAARLTRKAAAMAVATRSSRRLERKNDPTRWRRAELLWPFFTKG
jgi:hypothetical protein